MKKNIIILISMILGILLVGCKKEDQMASYIPTQKITPSPEELSEGEEIDAEDDNTDEAEVVKVEKYVKLKEFSAILNVRATPSTNGEKKGILTHGDKIEVVSMEDGWAGFYKNGELCYVRADFLVDEQPAKLEPPTATPTPIPEITQAQTPTVAPTPTPEPTKNPTPTVKPTQTPTPKPTTTPKPTKEPTQAPTPNGAQVTAKPKPTTSTEPTVKPEVTPTKKPTVTPSITEVPEEDTEEDD